MNGHGDESAGRTSRGGGKPTVKMTGNAARRAEVLGVTEILVTITHTDTSALVMAVAVGEHEA